MSTPAQGYVYILHVRGGLATGKKCSIHYVGWAKNWVYRVQAHKSGTARCVFTTECKRRGLALDVACVVRGSRALERRIKDSHQYARFCPACGGRLVDYRLAEQSLHIPTDYVQEVR